MDAGRTFLTSLTFPPEPLGWSKTPTSTPRAMALLTWFKLAADDMSSLYLSAKNLVDRWELQCDQYRRDRSPRRRDDLLLDGGTRDTLTGIGRARDTFLVERWERGASVWMRANRMSDAGVPRHDGGSNRNFVVVSPGRKARPESFGSFPIR